MHAEALSDTVHRLEPSPTSASVMCHTSLASNAASKLRTAGE